MKIHNYDRFDTANTPGSDRSAFTIWFAGCSVGCKGCQNPKLWDKERGMHISVKNILGIIGDSEDIVGKYKNIVLLGGEPMEQNHDELKSLLIGLYDRGYDVWLYTSWSFLDIPKSIRNHCKHIKTGEYEEDNRSDGLLASANQNFYHKVKHNIWRDMKGAEINEY